MDYAICAVLQTCFFFSAVLLVHEHKLYSPKCLTMSFSIVLFSHIQYHNFFKACCP